MNLQGPGGRNLTGSVNDKRICVPQKIDPKTFFANERTFLKWLSISVMIGLMSLTLLNFGDTSSTAAELAGLVLLPVSIIFMVYSLIVFRDRANKIYMREPMRYDDTRGPTMLVLVLGAAMVIATIFSIQRQYYKAITPTLRGGASFA
ncbi:vacuolar transporter chaperone [Trypanosoma conorhini]|uniref:Vacuolar transporter chaperone n=1 Tax=Trypanosoma conorhini TaxID=83891 RepID=A0A3R7KWC8_9TRYP|nr:vacuolar transporter chaperone [Trypanosoma conorhini]RNF16454.1 vacuolar transporter chaperone [Trypanosoma conorhini]